MDILPTDFSSASFQNLVRQAEQIEFERLQHKTIIPTCFIQELIDSPPNWLLESNFFDVNHKDSKRISSIHNLIDRQNRKHCY